MNIKRMDKRAILPTYGTKYSAGADLYALLDEDLVIAPSETVLVHTGICMEIPTGLVGLVFARSGLATKKGLAPANKVGVIDSDYRGEIMVPLHNHTKEEKVIKHGERIAQIIFMPYIMEQFDEVDELSETVRGEGGFGSTGR
ncbi:dUTP diphosphatase [Sneathia vaginalis]|jgi:dUTP diphosphatase|uniref:dUTP diphosphatase n=1 Tax=Sneathia vaginalis TaxID=187101 RepID=A0A0E3ZA76_9FUSO|nr:dUTP diphosphatase [Sneathia vaginalis]AKC95725.1 deoxyuridine 5'-triphosphate nucleotidohydrolase [Sneathia vaginalis]